VAKEVFDEKGLLITDEAFVTKFLSSNIKLYQLLLIKTS